MLLGVMRAAGELDSGASSAAAAPETAGLSSENSAEGTGVELKEFFFPTYFLEGMTCYI